MTSMYMSDFQQPGNRPLDNLLDIMTHQFAAKTLLGMRTGTILDALCRNLNAKRVLEFGTGLGDSTLGLAQAMKATGGKVVAIEKEFDFWKETQRKLQISRLTNYVELILGDIAEVVQELTGSFDVILQNANEQSFYPQLHEDSIALTRLGGIIVSDEIKHHSSLFPWEESIVRQSYNMSEDPRLFQTFLPVGEGLNISVKISN